MAVSTSFRSRDDLICDVFGFNKNQFLVDRQTYPDPDHVEIAHTKEGVYGNVSVFVREVAFNRHRRLEHLTVGWIAQVCVAEDQRGLGVAATLIGQAEDWLRDECVPFAALHAEDTRLYERIGYTEAPNLPGPGTAMVKPLAPTWPDGEVVWREGW